MAPLRQPGVAGGSGVTDRTDDIPQRVLALRSIFSETEPFHALQAEFTRQLGSRRAEIKAGRTLPVKGIALIGASGSGKSTLIPRLLRVTPTSCLPMMVKVGAMSSA